MIGVITIPRSFDAVTPVAGLGPLLRHALSLQAAGATEVRLFGAEVEAPRDSRLRIPVSRDGELDDDCVVLPADVTCHRHLPARLAHEMPGRADAIRTVGDGGACFAVGRDRARSLVAAILRGENPEARERPLAPDEFLLSSRDRAERRKAMRPHLRSLVKASSGFVDRHFMRPVSLRITRILVGVPVTPNQVSLLCLGMALCSALLVASSDAAASASGAVLFLIMRIVDCVDGELARLRYQGTRFGAWLDTVGDGIGILAFVGAVVSRLARSDPQGPWLVLGSVGLVAYAAVQGLQYWVVAAADGGGSLQAVEWSHRAPGVTGGARLLARIESLLRVDFVSVLFVALVLTGQLRVLIVLHTLMSVAVGGYFLLQLHGRRHSVRPERVDGRSTVGRPRARAASLGAPPTVVPRQRGPVGGCGPSRKGAGRRGGWRRRRGRSIRRRARLRRTRR